MTPTAAREIVIGIDVGTTSIKAVAIDLDGAVVGHASSRTMWDIGARSEVQVGMDSLADAAIDVMARTAQSVEFPVTVIGIGIAGLAETGVVVDSDGTPVTPAIVWYDQRGAEELAALPGDFRTGRQGRVLVLEAPLAAGTRLSGPGPDALAERAGVHRLPTHRHRGHRAVARIPNGPDRSERHHPLVGRP
jgi:glycerol kinase